MYTLELRGVRRVVWYILRRDVLSGHPANTEDASFPVSAHI